MDTGDVEALAEWGEVAWSSAVRARRNCVDGRVRVRSARAPGPCWRVSGAWRVVRKGVGVDPLVQGAIHWVAAYARCLARLPRFLYRAGAPASC